MRDNRRCGGRAGSRDGSEDIVGVLSKFNATLSAWLSAGRTFYGHCSYWHLIAPEFKDVEHGLALRPWKLYAPLLLAATIGIADLIRFRSGPIGWRLVAGDEV